MKKLRIILIALVIILGVLLATSVNQAYAVTRTLNRQDTRPYSDDDSDSTVGNDIYQIQREGPTLYRFVKIFDTANTTSGGETSTFKNFIYCLRSGKGFGNVTDTGATNNVTYNEIGEMHTDVNNIITDYLNKYSTTIDKTTTISINDSYNHPYNVNLYNAILWIADNAYLPLNMKNYDASSYKTELLTKVGIAKVNQNMITDDDLEVIQQLAFWYFTNYDEQQNGVTPSLSIASKNPFAGGGAITVNDNTLTSPRAAYLDKIYNYFIDNAILNSIKYGVADTRTITTPQLSFDKTLDFKIASSTIGTGAYEAYEIGPFKIAGTGIIDNSTFYLTDANGNTISQYYYLDSAHTQATKVFDIKATGATVAINSISNLETGKEYYVYLYKLYDGKQINPTVEGDTTKFDFSEIAFNLSTTYTTSNVKFLATESLEDQPLLEIEKDKISNGDKITTEKPGQFNFNLVKIKAGTDEKIAGINFTFEQVDKNLQTISGTTKAIVSTDDFASLIKNQAISKDGDFKPGTYYFKITEAETEGYFKLDSPIYVKMIIGEDNTGYKVTSATLVNADGTDNIVTNESVNIELSNNTITLTVENKEKVFDLALRKYITGLQSSEGTTKAIKNSDSEDNTRSLTSIDITPLTTNGTTANYKHRKDPVLVETGDIVTYTLKVYNEGDIDGWVTEVKDILPEGLEFITPTDLVNKDFVLEGQTSTGDAKYTYKVENGVLTIRPISGKETETVFDKLTAFDKTATTPALDYGEISFKCKVTTTVSTTNKVLTNVARITADKADGTNSDKADRDSDPITFEIPTNLSEYKGNSTNKTDLKDATYFYKGQEDDDDFEKIIILGEKFDLSLRKYITKINGTELETSREPQLDITPLEDNKESTTTASYIHSKEPIVVKQGDVITYKIRVYNEGARDGYVTNIADYIPEGLGFLPEYKANMNNNWALSSDAQAVNLKDLENVYNTAKSNLGLSDFEGITSLDNVQIVQGKTSITSNLLKEDKLNAYNKTKTTKENGENWQQAMNGKGTTGLYYEDVEVTCVVLAPNTCTDILKNIAEITGAKDSNGIEIKNIGDDVDSVPGTVNKDNYHDSEEDNGYWPGEQDDDDYEPVILQCFDLALRKFITGVNDKPVTSRVPQLSIDEKTQNIKYTHPKEEAPVEVTNSDVVIYTLRVYNEGTKAGYADLVTDDIPEGLVFLPDDQTNKTYKWVMYKEVVEKTEDTPTQTQEKIVTIDGKQYVETKDALEADMIQTDYLSKAQGEKQIETDTTLTENPNLLSAYNAANGITDGNPDYADIKVAFKVVEENTSDRVVINSAQISHDTDENGNEVTDEDSETNKWNDGEDDQDKEYIKVKYFDLSLYKWVTKTIVTVDGKTTTTETGFKPNIGKTENITEMEIRPNTENEPIASVSLDKKKLKSTAVKFSYSIMVMNEGEIPGYATEITDYIPTGLEFVAEDNTGYGWEQDGDNKVTTRYLESKLLDPGESTTIDIVFTWKNSSDNLGLKTNVAEISEDYNDSDSKDIDSTPGNKKDEYKEEQEDDDDFALVILNLKTGSAPTYITLATVTLAIIAGGTLLIKKYVL